MASSTEGYQDGAKNFQEWIEINKSRNRDSLIDQLSSSSLSSSSSQELINQCGKNGGLAKSGKKVRFKKKLRRNKDYSLNYRNHYRDGELRRNGGRSSQFCQLVKLLSTVGGFATLFALICIVISIQTKLDTLQKQIKAMNEHYLGLTGALSSLKKKSEEHDNLIFSLSNNFSAYRNSSAPWDEIISSQSKQSNITVTTKTLEDLISLPTRFQDLATSIRKLSLGISLHDKKIELLEERLNETTRAEEVLFKHFAQLRNGQVEIEAKLNATMYLVDHLTSLANSNATINHDGSLPNLH